MMRTHRPFEISRILAGVATMLLASQAFAHGTTPGTTAFVAGFLHPLTALEHVLPLIALGMLAGQRGLVSGQGLLIAFPFAFACGALAGSSVGELPAINATTALVAGGLVALAFALPRALLYAIVVVVGAIHGLSNGAVTGQSLLVFIGGATLASALLFGYAFGVTHYVLKQPMPWLPIAVRAIGSWIAAFGILTLTLAFASSPSVVTALAI